MAIYRLKTLLKTLAFNIPGTKALAAETLAIETLVAEKVVAEKVAAEI